MLIGSSPRGFTLIELMLSLIIVLVVSGTLYRLVFSTQRLSRAQAARIAAQSSLRGAALVVSSELRELSTVPGGTGAENDIRSLSSSAISYRATRGFGYTCQALGPGVLRLSRTGFTGFRDPQAGKDSAWVYAPSLAVPSDSGWIPAAITNVSLSTACPGALGPGITLATAALPPMDPVPAGTPVRIYELMELASYRSEGQWWLGMRSISSGEFIQPLFGPLAENGGFQLGFADAFGVATASPSAVRSVEITLRGSSEVDPWSGAALLEQVKTRVQLRNGH